MFTKAQTDIDRLAAWRKFRQQFPKTGTAHDVVKAFSNVKLETRYLDYYTPNNWLNVFEIVKHGNFCQSGLTLIITSTLLHLKLVNPSSLCFDVVSNHITGATGLIFTNENLVYNFLPGEIVTEQYAKDNATYFMQHIIALDKFSY